MTREKYEEITSHLLDRTKNLLDDLLKTAEKQGYPISKIDKVLLVGGSSKMPQVAAMLERDYQVKASLQDPDEAVAKGAAIYAVNEKQFSDFVLEEAQKRGATVEELVEENLQSRELEQKFMRASVGGPNAMKISITNVLSRTYGLSALDANEEEKIFNMLKINDKLPAQSKQSFYTYSPNQTGVAMDIYESRSVEDCMPIEGRKPVTTIQMTFTKQVPQNTEIQVSLMLDNSGILHVVAEEMLYHSKLDTTFKLSNQMSDTELQQAGRRLKDATVE